LKKWFLVLVGLVLFSSMALALDVVMTAKVNNSSGSPLAGATVQYTVDSQTFPSNLTNSNGISYPIRATAGKAYTLKVSKSGYNTATVNGTVPYTNTSFVNNVILSTSSSTPPSTNYTQLQITVKDSQNNSKIGGARIEVSKYDFVSTKTTLSDGTTNFSLISGRSYTVKTTKSGFHSDTRIINVSGNSQSATINLSQIESPSPIPPQNNDGVSLAVNVQVRAYVTNQNNMPLNGASVTYTADGYPYPGGTTVNGFANIVTLQPGQVGTAHVTLFGYNSASQSFVVGQGPSQTVTVTLSQQNQPLPQNMEVRAKAVNANTGATIQGASVTYFANGQSFSGGFTDSQGLASLAAFLQPGTSGTITVTATGFSSASANFSVPSSGPHIVQAFLSPISQPPQPQPSNVQVNVKVVNSNNGSGISNANVYINALNNTYQLGTTDSQGMTSGVFLPAGTNGTAFANASGFSSNSSSFTVQSTGMQTIQINLSPTSSPPSGNDAPSINNLPNRHFEENSGFHNNTIDLWDFAFDDEDSDSELSFSLSQSNTGLIFCYIDEDRFVDCQEPNNNDTGDSTITVTVRDTSGLTDSDTFTIFVEDDGFDDDDDDGSSGNSMCSDIEISTENIFVQEGRTITKQIEVFNDNTRSFEVKQVSVSESSADYSVSPLDDDFTISGNETEEISLRFTTRNVSGSKKSTLKVRISGEFSNGVDCDISDIVEELDVTVQNNSTENELDLTVSPQNIEMLSGETKIAKLTIQNDFSSRKCIELSATENSSTVSASVEDDEFCINARDEREIDVVINSSSVSSTQNATVQLKAEVSGNSEFAFINVKVSPRGGQGQPTDGQGITIESFEDEIAIQKNQSKTFTATIANHSSTDATNIAVTMENLPQGVFFEPVFIPRLAKNSVTTVSTSIRTVLPEGGTYRTLLEASSDQGKSVREATVTVPSEAQPPVDTGGTGLAGLAGSLGIALILLLILVLFVVLIVALLREK